MAERNPFELLGLEARFAIERAELERVHRELSKTLHPDRHRDKPAGERRLLLERAMQVNEAYRVVRDPIRRARALLGLRGVTLDENTEVSPPPMFLMDVMEQRETLAEARHARDVARIQELARAVRARQGSTERNLASAFEAPELDRDTLLSLVGELNYDVRFLEEANAAVEELESAPS